MPGRALRLDAPAPPAGGMRPPAPPSACRIWPGLDAMAVLFDGLSLKDQRHYLKVLGPLLDAMNSPPVPAEAIT